MLEILSPAGCPEGVIAAVQNGADAIYLGFRDSDDRRGAQNFSKAEMGRALEYCRVRGVKTYLALDSLAYGREFPKLERYAKDASQLGIDAVIVQDLGVMMAVRRWAPEVPIHADSRMDIHNLEGVKMAAAMGIKRVAASHGLTRKKLAYICRSSPIEIEVFAHGSMCIGNSGRCYFSAASGGSANRGECSRPCRKNYDAGGASTQYPLSMKDNCLARYMADLESIGVSSVRIQSDAKRPEHTAIVTAIYSKAAHSGRAPSHEEMRAFQKAVSSQGFTDGFYSDRQDSGMVGMPSSDYDADSVAYATARKNYLNGEYQRVPVRFVGKISSGKRVKLAAADDKGNSAVVYGPVPHPAFHRELNIAALRTQLYKTSGTPFLCVGVKGSVEPGLSLSISDFNEMRRDLLAEILEQRRPVRMRAEGDFVPHEFIPNEDRQPALIVSVMKADQLSKAMEELCPRMVYIPAMEFDFDSPILRSFLENDEITVAAALPHVIHDNERRRLSETLSRAAKLGVTDALVGNIGHIQFARGHGMEVRGDYSLNVFNSEALWALRHLRLKSATLSFELRLAEIREISKPIDTELITYGRLPLMATGNCIVRNSTGACTCDNFPGLTDVSGAVFPVTAEFGCRNVVLNSKKLFMADRKHAVASLGLWAERLFFTTENALECVAVMKRYKNIGSYGLPGYTRGMYYRGVGFES